MSTFTANGSEAVRVIVREIAHLETVVAELRARNRRLERTVSEVRESRERWKKLCRDAEWASGMRDRKSR